MNSRTPARLPAMFTVCASIRLGARASGAAQLLARPEHCQRDEHEQHAGHHLDRQHELRRIARSRFGAEEHQLRRRDVADAERRASCARATTRCRAPRRGADREERRRPRDVVARAIGRETPDRHPEKHASRTVLVKNVRNSTCAGNQRMAASSRNST